MVKKSLTRRPNAEDKFVKLVLFQTAPGAEISPGVLTGRGIVDISAEVKKGHTPQLTMQGIIDEFERLRPALDKPVKAMPFGSIKCACGRRCLAPARFSPALTITGSMPSASRARSTCS